MYEGNTNAWAPKPLHNGRFSLAVARCYSASGKVLNGTEIGPRERISLEPRRSAGRDTPSTPNSDGSGRAANERNLIETEACGVTG